jgi:VWFA-related protein
MSAGPISAFASPSRSRPPRLAIIVVLCLGAAAGTTSRARAPETPRDAAAPVDPGAPTVQIVSPPADRPVAGALTVKAEIRAGASRIVRVLFQVDGREIGRRDSPPWEIPWDAGLEYAMHAIEVVALDADGHRTTARQITPPILLRERVMVLDTAVQEVRLTVTVTGRSGQSVTGLTMNDFLVSEDGRVQQIVDFGREGERVDRPLSVLLLVDRSLSMRVHLEDLSKAVGALLGSLRPADEVGVASVVNGEFELAQPFVGRGEPLDPGLATIGSAAGGTPLFDAIERGLKLMRDRPGRRVILALTDGWDDRLRLNVSFFQSNYLLDLARKAQRSNTQIMMIWPGPPAHGTLAIESLVQETGGLIYFLRADMPELLAQIGRDLQEQYYLSYFSEVRERDARRRKIEVVVRRPEVQVRSVGGVFPLPAQVEILRADLKDSDPAVRAEAARTLAGVEAEEATRLLRSALHDRAIPVRMEAARGLGLRGGAETIEPLVRALEDGAPEVRTAAYDALLSLGQPATLTLIERLPKGDETTRVLTLQLLGEIGDDRALDPVAAHTVSAPPTERAAAATALGRLGFSAGLPALGRLLSEPDTRLRTLAIGAIARIGGLEAVRMLEGYGGREPDPELRRQAADAVDQILAAIRDAAAHSDGTKPPR